MKVEESEAILTRLLREAEIDLDQPRVEDVQRAWQCFKQFCRLPAERAEDGILFQCGIFTFTGEPLYYFDYVRQFECEGLEGDDALLQLHCEFRFTPTDEMAELDTNLWSFDYPTLDDYFAAVEGLPEFQATVGRFTPAQLSVTLGGV